MAPFARYTLNSLIVVIASTIGELITTMQPMPFHELTFMDEILLFYSLGTMMVPGEVLLIPNFVTLANLGWIDQYEALIVPWLASIFSVFLLRQFFLSIPKEFSFAAKIDGCSDFRFLWSVMVPLAKPALITIAILKAIGSWNAFMWPLIVTVLKICELYQ